jgi:hypothetical protein
MNTFYKRLLRLYPANYYREYAEEMTTVFDQARRDLCGAHRLQRIVFFLREFAGAVRGAVHERLHSSFGWDPYRRFDMRPEFRFPRSTVTLMLVILAGVLIAIDKAKAIQLKYGAAYAMSGFGTVEFIALMVGLGCVAVATAWGILFALHRSGTHRLANLEPQSTK